MPGDDWQQFANLRGCMDICGAIGKKLLFMGGEFAQRREWTHEGDSSGGFPPSRACRRSTAHAHLNRVYRSEPACIKLILPDGFEWLDVDDADISVIAFLRKSAPANPCSWRATSHRCLARTSCWRSNRALARDPQYGRARIRRRRWGNLAGSNRCRSAPMAAPSRSISPCRRSRHHAALEAMAEKRRRTAAKTMTWSRHPGEGA